MGFVFYNPNPKGLFTSDCVIRAISKLLNLSWDETYLNLAMWGFDRKSIISSDDVWCDYLKSHGFTMGVVPDTCPDCYTVRQFAADNPVGKYLLKIPGHSAGHVVAVVDGNYYDTWDCGSSYPIYYLGRDY